MPVRKAPVWTTGRKWVGNVVPLLVACPLLGVGVWTFLREGLVPSALIWLGAFPVVGWLAVNFLALMGNKGLRRQIENRFLAEKPETKGDKFFVGFSTPKYRDALDPHEDVGFLILGESDLEFYGGHLNFSFRRSSIQKVKFQANPHSFLFLGKFIRIEAEEDGSPVVVLVEARERKTLWGNRILTQQLRKQIQDYAQTPPGS